MRRRRQPCCSSSSRSTCRRLVTMLGAMVTAAAAAAAAPEQAVPFTFLTIGDWGAGTDNQTAVATSMGLYAQRLAPQFVVALGDNIYETGVQSTDDPLWESRYCGVYTDAALNVPWFAILGNHDHYGGHPEAQIEYFNQNLDPAGRWVMPDFFYTRTWDDVGGGKSLQIVFIDTVLLAQEAFHDSFRKEVRAALAPQSNLDSWQRAAPALEHRRFEGYKWINDTLAASTADWLIVAGHFPVYSAGAHGDTPELKQFLRPLLEAYEVDAYMCGHDHVLEYLRDKEEGQGVAYFVSGSGGQDVYKVSPTPETVFAVEESGFMVHSFSPSGDQMTVDIVHRDGGVLYSLAMPQKRSAGGKGKKEEQVVQATVGVAVPSAV